MENENIIWAVCIVSAIGLISLGAYVYFAKSVFNQQLISSKDKPTHLYFLDLLAFLKNAENKANYEALISAISEAYSEYLQKRNDFWTSYGQIIDPKKPNSPQEDPNFR